MLTFEALDISRKAEYESYLRCGTERGCEYSVANLSMWGRQKVAFVGGRLVLMSQYNRRSVYPYPVGTGEVEPALEAIMEDAKKRGIVCRITGMNRAEADDLLARYPGKFRVHCDRDSFDYVYALEDLANLKGRKYQRKRNHVNRFWAEHPDCEVVPITPALFPQIQTMLEAWYLKRLADAPQNDYYMEQVALSRCLRHWQALELMGVALVGNGQVLAFSVGSRLSENTVDVHFEKALSDADGAYAAINQSFARYVQSRLPQVAFLNREDDLGLEGLRKAKLSYLPHHMVEKYWADAVEDGYVY